MSTVSNKAIVNGGVPPADTGADVRNAKVCQRKRLELFMNDNNGPVPLFGQTVASINQRLAEKADAINKMISKVDT